VWRGVAACGAFLVTAFLVGGCGASGSSSSGSGAQPPPGSAGAILARPGPDVALTPGTSDYARGPVRVVFLVINRKGRLIERPRARVWVARSLDDKPLVSTTATLEDVGVPGVSEAEAGEVTKLYVTRFPVSNEGKYVLVAQPVGGPPIQGLLDLNVKTKPDAPAVGSKAFPSRNPTIASTGGDLKALTTRTPADVGLLRYSVADSLKAHAPFVVTFATPAFCTSRACGPVVDVVDAVRKRFGGTGVRFIHIEIYRDNQPPETNQWVNEWRLRTEPWTFLVGRDGRIKARFEGSVSVDELNAAVRRYLVGSS
jgi:hypothetical protein